jgi:hypothetical protein
MNRNLTINKTSPILKTSNLNLKTFYNYFKKSEIKLNNTIRKGYVPLIILSGTSISLPFKNINETYSDYVGLKFAASDDLIFEIEIADLIFINKAYKNINIAFNFTQPTYSNYTLTNRFDSFGQFHINLYSNIGGNFLSQAGPINIQCVDNYTQMSKF